MTGKLQQKTPAAVRQYSAEEILFFIYFAVMLLCKGTGMTDGPAYKLCLAGASAIVLLKLLIGRHTALEAVCIAALLSLAAAVLYLSRNQGVFLCILAVLAMKGVRLQDVWKEGAFLWGGTFVFQIVTQLLNLRARDFVIHDKLHLGYVIRWALGYSHPNVLMIAFVVLVFYLGCACRAEGKRLRRLIAGVLLDGLYVFLYSLSVTGLVFLVLFLLLARLFDRVRTARGESAAVSFLWKLKNPLIQLVFPLAVGLSVLGPLVFRGKLFDFFNRILNTRFFLSRYMMRRENFSLFGKELADATLTLDCSYTNLLIYGGALVFFLMLAAYVLLICDMLRDMDKAEGCFAMAGTLALLVAGISEPFLFNTSYKNPTLFLMGYYLYRRLERAGGREYCILPLRLHRLERLFADAAGVAGGMAGLAGMAAEKGACESGSADGRAVKIKIAGRLGFIAAVTLLCMLTVWKFYRFPSTVYAPRSSSTADDTRANLYFTEAQVQALREDKDVLVLQYRDENTPMQKFEDVSIAQVERIRMTVTAGAAGMAAACLASSLWRSIRRRRLCYNGRAG